MIPYFLLYFIPAWIAISDAHKRLNKSKVAWSIAGVILILFVGLRESGGDYLNYRRMYHLLHNHNLSYMSKSGDIGYDTLSYYLNQWGFEFWVLTLVCATVSVVGLIKFLQKQDNPWLGLSIAIPYLLIVVYMGYMRQGVAIGLVMWGITKLNEDKFLSFVFFVFLAVLFHKTAILMLSFGIFYKKSGKWLKILALLIAGIGLWYAFVQQASVGLWKNYVSAGMVSNGALIRVILNAIPAFLLLKYGRFFKKEYKDYNFWKIIAITSLLLIPLVPFASTAVDRIALYFLPLQIVVLTRIPKLLDKRFAPKVTMFVMVVVFYFIELLVWLSLGNNAFYWLPYRNLLWSSGV